MLSRMFLAGKTSGLLAVQFSSQTLLLRSHAFVTDAVLHRLAERCKAFPEKDIA